MTIGAAPVEDEPGIDVSRGAGMSRMHVTLGAQPGVSYLEQPVIYGTVRLVAVGAILDDRGMLPKERTASLRMTRVAIFIDACLLELGRIRSPVRIVTIGTGHLSFSERHVR